MSQLLEAHAPSLFTPQRADQEAARARRMESIYFVGQAKAWDGRAVLQEVLARHPAPPGQPRLSAQHSQALARVFSTLMWGELAAWRTAAQQADQLPDHEMRLAATAQAHDEARHYYVLHDYLVSLGVHVPPLDRHTRAFLNLILSTRHPLQKMVGMQLLVETIALTIFKMVRDMNVDPALTELLAYYEKDEARHVGFGVQAAPILMENAGTWARLGLAVFEVRVLRHMLRGLGSMQQELAQVGVNVRDLVEEGGRRFARILDDYGQERRRTREGRLLGRFYGAALEWFFPRSPAGPTARARAAWRAFVAGTALS
jgi:hypothetical protein